MGRHFCFRPSIYWEHFKRKTRVLIAKIGALMAKNFISQIFIISKINYLYTKQINFIRVSIGDEMKETIEGF